MGESHFGTVVAEDGFKIGNAASSTAFITGVYEYSGAADFASIADGNMETKSVTVTGAAVGDYVLCNLGVDIVDHQLTGTVISANTVEVTLSNSGAVATDFASATLKVLVISTA